jgi:Tfp pilus assembly protein PilO
MQMDKLFRKYQNSIVSGVLLLFCILATVFAVIPSIGKIQQLIADLRVMTEETTALKKKLDTLTALDEGTLRTNLTNVLSAVPAERSFPTVFETVESVAAQTGVSVVSMSISGGASLATPAASQVSAADKKLGTRTIPFSVTINGSLSGIEQFIALIPQVRRLLRIRVFSIAFPKDDRPLTVIVDMDAFYEPLPSTIGNAKAVLPQLTDADFTMINRLTALPLASQESGALPPPLIGKSKENPFSP